MGVYSGNTTIAVVQDGQSNQYAIEVSNDSVYNNLVNLLVLKVKGKK